MEKLLTIREVAEHLGIATGTAYHWLSAGRLPCVRLSSRCVRFRESDVERCWNSCAAVTGMKYGRIYAVMVGGPEVLNWRRNRMKIFVANFDRKTRESELEELFSEYGRVQEATIAFNWKTRSRKNGDLLKYKTMMTLNEQSASLMVAGGMDGD